MDERILRLARTARLFRGRAQFQPLWSGGEGLPGDRELTCCVGWEWIGQPPKMDAAAGKDALSGLTHNFDLRYALPGTEVWCVLFARSTAPWQDMALHDISCA